MKNKIKMALFAGLLVSGLSACSTQQVVSGAIGVAKLPAKAVGATGRVVGGVAGGAIGGLVGGSIGRSVGHAVGRAAGGYAAGNQ